MNTMGKNLKVSSPKKIDCPSLKYSACNNHKSVCKWDGSVADGQCIRPRK